MSLQGPTSYQIPGRAPKPRRPGAVTAASNLMFVGAGLIAALGALATVEGLLTKDAAAESAAGRHPGDPWPYRRRHHRRCGRVRAVRGGLRHARRADPAGRNPARIVTWVVTGLFGLCCGCSDVLGAIGTAIPIDSQTPTGSVNSAVAATRPGWYTAGNLAASIALVVVCLVVIVLLALPVANDYFRREQETWVPPAWPTAPGGGYAFPGTAVPAAARDPAVPAVPLPGGAGRTFAGAR